MNKYVVNDKSVINIELVKTANIMIFYKMNKIKSLVKYIVILGVILFIDAVIYEPYSIKITSYDITNQQLSGLKIVFASDFHIAPYKWEKWRLQKIVSTINEQNPDLVVLGGDYVNRHSKTSTMAPQKIIEAIQNIKAPKVAVLGNHDIYYGKDDVIEALTNASIPVLNNRNIKLNLQNKDVYVAGVSDYDTDKPDVKKAFEGIQSPAIFVTHSPDVFDALEENFDIAFAGHTHGGQIVLPFLGALAINTDSGRKYTYGRFDKNDKTMIVSSGLGSSVIPVRFNNLPEIVVVSIR